jgi:predicted nucleic acid-binding protein
VSYLIDTNIICEVRKGARCNLHVAAWFASIDDADIYLSVLTVGEIRRGIERMRTRDPEQSRALDRWLAEVAKSYSGRIIPIDQATAEVWGQMSAIRPVPAIDALMAATAKVHHMTLATRNVTHVADLGASVLNPFEPAIRAL